MSQAVGSKTINQRIFPFPLLQVEVKYGERTSSDCPKLGKLHSSYKWLKEEGGKPPKPSASSAATTPTAAAAAGAGAKERNGKKGGDQDPNYV